MDDIKLCAKNEKELETLIQAVRIYNQDTRMEIWHRKIHYTNNEKREMSPDGGNRTIKPRQNQNTRRKGKLQVLGNIGSRIYNQDTGMEFGIKNTLY